MLKIRCRPYLFTEYPIRNAYINLHPFDLFLKYLMYFSCASLCSKETDGLTQQKLRSKNRRSSIIHRRGQKQLTRLFLKEAEHALQLAFSERN